MERQISVRSKNESIAKYHCIQQFGNCFLSAALITQENFQEQKEFYGHFVEKAAGGKEGTALKLITI